LPPERLFIEELRVSREQLRLARNGLRKEGWIKRSVSTSGVRVSTAEATGTPRQATIMDRHLTRLFLWIITTDH